MKSENSYLSNSARNYLEEFYEILNEMIEEMTEVKLTDSISHNFIMQMIPHHMAAIEMSVNILQYTTKDTLRNISLSIINEQTLSIKNMRDILDNCSKLTNKATQLSIYQSQFRQITQVMFHEMRNASATNNIDADFLNEMIPHHEGAIRMSENALYFSICPELVPILQAIITSQRAGVRQMKELLNSI